MGKEREPSLAWLLWEHFFIDYKRQRSSPWPEQPSSKGLPAQGCAYRTGSHKMSPQSPWYARCLLSWSPLPREGRPPGSPSGMALAQPQRHCLLLQASMSSLPSPTPPMLLTVEGQVPEPSPAGKAARPQTTASQQLWLCFGKDQTILPVGRGLG